MAKKTKEQEDLDNKLVFGLAPPKPGTPATLVVAIPQKAWEHIRDGKTQNFTLEPLGIPFQMVIFGGPTHEKCRADLEATIKAAGTKDIDDLTATDFTIKDQKDGPKAGK